MQRFLCSRARQSATWRCGSLAGAVKRAIFFREKDKGDYPSDVTLLRATSETPDPATDRRTPRRVRKTPVKPDETVIAQPRKPEKQPVDPEERMRHIAAVLLLLAGVLLLLAVVSYTPND